MAVKNQNSSLSDSIIHCKKYFPHVCYIELKRWVTKGTCFTGNQSEDYLNDPEQEQISKARLYL